MTMLSSPRTALLKRAAPLVVFGFLIVHVLVRIDMNGDGVEELFVHDRAMSGTGGRMFVLFHRQDGEWRAISLSLGWIALLDEVGGWRRYSSLSSGGGGHLARVLLEYCDGRYRAVRWERWDSRASDVVIETSTCEAAPGPSF